MVGDKHHNADQEKRPFLGIIFECCNVYARIYKNKEATAYEGRCPRCSRKLSVPIGPEGTPSRYFRGR
jgi:hypothetical protein